MTYFVTSSRQKYVSHNKNVMTKLPHDIKVITKARLDIDLIYDVKVSSAIKKYAMMSKNTPRFQKWVMLSNSTSYTMCSQIVHHVSNSTPWRRRVSHDDKILSCHRKFIRLQDGNNLIESQWVLDNETRVLQRPSGTMMKPIYIFSHSTQDVFNLRKIQLYVGFSLYWTKQSALWSDYRTLQLFRPY